MKKRSLVIYYDILEELEDFSDAQVGQIFRAMVKYDETGTLPNFSGSMKTAFKFIKTKLDKNKDDYAKKCEKNRENINKRWKNKENEDSNVYDCIQSYNSYTKDTDTDNDTDNDINISKQVSNKKINNNNLGISNTHAHACVREIESYDEIFENFCVSPALKETYISFIKHCKANGHVVVNDKLKNMIIKLDIAYGNDDTPKHASLKRAISGGYLDIKECVE